MTSYIVPPALRAGDTIAFVSPSSRLNQLFPHRVEKAKQFWTDLGFKVKVIFTPQLSSDHLESIKQRCDELHDAFRDTSIKAIICTIGGFSSNELLPHLDYHLIKSNPKIFCGFSDITNLHQAIHTMTGLRTFYGPAAITQWGERPRPFEFTVDSFIKTVGSAGLQSSYTIPQSPYWTDEFSDWFEEPKHDRNRQLTRVAPWKWLRSGKAQGNLCGGCLQSLTQLAGTAYFPDYQGKILLLELAEGAGPGLPTDPVLARCWLSDLRNAGVLDKVVGLAFGIPYQFTDQAREEFEKVLVDQCYHTSFPILTNVSFGHTDPLVTMPLGAMAELDSDQNSFRILEATVTS